MSFKQISLAILIAFCAMWPMGMVVMGAELVAHWPFNQNSGKEVKDVVGGHHGQVKGGDAAWVPGKFENGLQIKGPNHYVEVEQAVELELKTLTFIAWIKLDSAAGRQEIVSYADSYVVMADGGLFHAFIFAIKGGGEWGNWWPVHGKIAVEAGKWYQTAVTIDAKEIQLYVNGKLDAKADIPGVEYQDFAMWFGGGPADNTFWLTGVLDQIEIWDDVLSDAEIMGLFNEPAGLAVKPNSDKLTTTWGRLKF